MRGDDDQHRIKWFTAISDESNARALPSTQLFQTVLVSDDS